MTFDLSCVTFDLTFVPSSLLDYEKVITHCIQQGHYTKALNILTDKASALLDLPSKERTIRFEPFANLFYKFSPSLVKRCAAETVDAWIKMKKLLEPHKLIPSLIQCNQNADSVQVSYYWRCCCDVVMMMSHADVGCCPLSGVLCGETEQY